MVMKRIRRYAKKQAKRAYGWAKKRYTTKGGIARLMSDVSMLKTAINVEHKNWDRTAIVPADVTYTSPPTILPWDGMNQDNTNNGRNGDQVKALYTQVRMHFEAQGTTLTAGNNHTVRVIAFVDKMARFATPLSGLTLRDIILAEATTGPGAIISPYQMGNTSNGTVGGRFKIIRDFKFKLDNVTQKSKVVTVNINHKKYSSSKHGQVIKYETSSLNDYPEQRLYVMLLSDNGSADQIYFYYHSRVVYVDN